MTATPQVSLPMIPLFSDACSLYMHTTSYILNFKPICGIIPAVLQSTALDKGAIRQSVLEYSIPLIPHQLAKLAANTILVIHVCVFLNVYVCRLGTVDQTRLPGSDYPFFLNIVWTTQVMPSFIVIFSIVIAFVTTFTMQ